MLHCKNFGSILAHVCEYDVINHLGNCYIDDSPFFTAVGLARIVDVQTEKPRGIRFYIEPWKGNRKIVYKRRRIVQ